MRKLNFKAFILIVLVAVLGFSLAACNKGGGGEAPSNVRSITTNDYLTNLVSSSKVLGNSNITSNTDDIKISADVELKLEKRTKLTDGGQKSILNLGLKLEVIFDRVEYKNSSINVTVRDLEKADTDANKIKFTAFLNDASNIYIDLLGQKVRFAYDDGVISLNANQLDSFIDANANGVYDEGETYVDGNSNGKFDKEHLAHPVNMIKYAVEAKKTNIDKNNPTDNTEELRKTSLNELLDAMFINTKGDQWTVGTPIDSLLTWLNKDTTIKNLLNKFLGEGSLLADLGRSLNECLWDTNGHINLIGLLRWSMLTNFFDATKQTVTVNGDRSTYATALKVGDLKSMLGLAGGFLPVNLSEVMKLVDSETVMELYYDTVKNGEVAEIDNFTIMMALKGLSQNANLADKSYPVITLKINDLDISKVDAATENSGFAKAQYSDKFDMQVNAAFAVSGIKINDVDFSGAYTLNANGSFDMVNKDGTNNAMQLALTKDGTDLIKASYVGNVLNIKLAKNNAQIKAFFETAGPVVFKSLSQINSLYDTDANADANSAVFALIQKMYGADKLSLTTNKYEAICKVSGNMYKLDPVYNENFDGISISNLSIQKLMYEGLMEKMLRTEPLIEKEYDPTKVTDLGIMESLKDWESKFNMIVLFKNLMTYIQPNVNTQNLLALSTRSFKSLFDDVLVPSGFENSTNKDRTLYAFLMGKSSNYTEFFQWDTEKNLTGIMVRNNYKWEKEQIEFMYDLATGVAGYTVYSNWYDYSTGTKTYADYTTAGGTLKEAEFNAYKQKLGLYVSGTKLSNADFDLYIKNSPIMQACAILKGTAFAADPDKLMEKVFSARADLSLKVLENGIALAGKLYRTDAAINITNLSIKLNAMTTLPTVTAVQLDVANSATISIKYKV